MLCLNIDFRLSGLSMVYRTSNGPRNNTVKCLAAITPVTKPSSSDSVINGNKLQDHYFSLFFLYIGCVSKLPEKDPYDVLDKYKYIPPRV